MPASLGPWSYRSPRPLVPQRLSIARHRTSGHTPRGSFAPRLIDNFSAEPNTEFFLLGQSHARGFGNGWSGRT